MAIHLKAALAFGLLLAAAPVSAQPAPGPQTLQPDAEEYLQHAASVIVLNELQQQGDVGGKLFGTAGGDPAMNGLYTYLSFYISPQDGWRVFRIGDFLEYRLVSEAAGRVVLDVHESTMNAGGDIGSRTRRIAVTWTAPADGSPPATVTVTPAPSP